VYQDEKLGRDKKSYAVSFLFPMKRKTLTDGEVDKMIENLVTHYETQLSAQIRR
jgi:phenylalanyl-tRNA synthetase beta chain